MMMQRLFGGLVATMALVGLSHFFIPTRAQENPGAIPVVPIAPQSGLVVVGQNGVVQVTPDGISTIVPDQRAGALPQAGQSSPQQAGVAQPQPPQPVVCECACPACPANPNVGDAASAAPPPDTVYDSDSESE